MIIETNILPVNPTKNHLYKNVFIDVVHSISDSSLLVRLDSQPQVIKLTNCLPMVGGSLRVLRHSPPLKLVAMI